MKSMVVIGASMGGHAPLLRILADLPADLPAAVLVVLHTAPNSPGLLPDILARASKLKVRHAVDGERPAAGTVYAAPPDRHLSVERGRLRVTRGPTHNGSRPAVDPMFRSVAAEYGRRAIGVVLSGLLDCGAAGLFAIHRAGGLAIVQDLGEAVAADMPRAALELVPDARLRMAAEIAPEILRTLLALDADDVPSTRVPMASLVQRISTAQEVYSCPECGGPTRAGEGTPPKEYACRVGHAFSGVSLDSKQGQALEGALWSACRILEERVDLSRRLADQARASGHFITEEKFVERSEEFRDKAKRVRDMLMALPSPLQEHQH